MKKHLVFIGLVFIVLLFGSNYIFYHTGVDYGEKVAQQSTVTSTDDLLTKEKLMILVNGERLKNKINGLNYDKQLTDFAEIRAKEVYENKDTLHQGLSLHRQNNTLPVNCPSDRLGENIYYNFSGNPITNKEVIDGWMNSPAHRPNILNKNYQWYGIGIYNYNVALEFCLKEGKTFESGL